MKNLLVFTAWAFGALMTAVIPAGLIALLTPATYDGIMSSPVYVAVTSLFGTCLLGVYVAEEVHNFLHKD